MALFSPAALAAAAIALTAVGAHGAHGGGHVSARDASPVASVYVSPTGSDTGADCIRLAAPAPAPPASSVCASMTRALALALPGDVIQLLPGDYGSLTISRQAGGDDPPVTVRGDVNLAQQAGCSQGCGVGNVVVHNLVVCGHGLAVRNIDSSGIYDYVYVGASACPGEPISSNYDLALVNVHFNAGTLRGHDLLLSGSRIGPNEHICDDPENREDNLHIWPSTQTTPWTVPYDITLDHDLIYDAVMSTPGCGGAHADLIQTLGYRNLTIENSVFWRPAHSFIQDGTIRGTTVGGATIVNNFFGGPSAPGGGYTHLGNPDPGGPCVNGSYTIENNTWAPGSALLACSNAAQMANVWRNNYVRVSADQPTTCGSGTWDHNVFAPGGIVCGTAAKQCAPTWLWSTATTGDFVRGPDLHLAASDRCLRGAGSPPAPGDAAAARDIDGDMRPLTVAADVGADQRESAAIAAGLGIGNVRLGESTADVVGFYGDPARRTSSRLAPKQPRIVLGTYSLHGGRLWVAYDHDRVVAVGTSSRYYSTTTGVGPGAQPAGAPAGRWLSCRSAYVRTNGSTLTTFTAGRPGGRITAAWIIDRRYGGAAHC